MSIGELLEEGGKINSNKFLRPSTMKPSSKRIPYWRIINSACKLKLKLTCYQRKKKCHKDECVNLHTSLNSLVSKFVEINMRNKMSRHMDKCDIIVN